MNGNNRTLMQAIRGPIMMITIGVLFALNQTTEFTFGKTWPAILIVLGLLSLGDRFSGPKSGAVTSRRDPNFGGDK
jgi:cell wall-active antibiotic response 4TMS protein YvqF